MSLLRGARGAPVIAEQFDGPPQGGRGTMWIGGVVVALLMSIPADFAIAASRIMLAVFFISFGLILHFHYFWGLHPKLCGCSEFAKNVAALGMIVPILYGLFYLIVHIVAI